MAKRGRKRKRLYTLPKSRRNPKTVKHVETEEEPRLQSVSDKNVEISEDQTNRIILQQAPSSAKSFKIEVLNKNPGIIVNGRGKKFVLVSPKRILDQESNDDIFLNKKSKLETSLPIKPNVQILSAHASSNQNYDESLYPGISQCGNSETVIINVSQPPMNKIDVAPSLFIQHEPSPIFSVPNSTQSNTSISSFAEEREVHLHIEEDEALNFSEHLSILDAIEADVDNGGSVSMSKDPGNIVSYNDPSLLTNTFSVPKPNAQKLLKIVSEGQMNIPSTVRQVSSTILKSTSPSVISFNNYSTHIVNKYSIGSTPKSTNVIMATQTQPSLSSIPPVSVGKAMPSGSITVPNLVLKTGSAVRFINPGSRTTNSVINTTSTSAIVKNHGVLRIPTSNTLSMNVYHNGNLPDKIENHVNVTQTAKCLLKSSKIITKYLPMNENSVPTSIGVPNTTILHYPATTTSGRATLCVPIASSSSSSTTLKNEEYRSSLSNTEPLKINLKSVHLPEMNKLKGETIQQKIIVSQSNTNFITLTSDDQAKDDYTFKESYTVAPSHLGARVKSSDSDTTEGLNQTSSSISEQEEDIPYEETSIENFETSMQSPTSSSIKDIDIKTEEVNDENSDFDMRALQRRRRIAFTPRQYKLLQTTFEHNNFPEPIEQRSIAQQLGAPYRSIKMWFQNKRAAVRKRLGPEASRAIGCPRNKYKNVADTNNCFYCDICPSAFIAQAFLNRHKEYHDIKTYSCVSCKSSFTHNDLLITHMKAKCKKSNSELVVREAHVESGITSSTQKEKDLMLKSTQLEIHEELIGNKHGNTSVSSSSRHERLPTVLNVPNPQFSSSHSSSSMYHNNYSSNTELNNSHAGQNQYNSTESTRSFSTITTHTNESEMKQATDFPSQSDRFTTDQENCEPINLKKISESTDDNNFCLKNESNTKLLHALTKGKLFNGPYLVESKENKKMDENKMSLNKIEIKQETEIENTKKTDEESEKVDLEQQVNNHLLHQLFLNHLKQQQQDQEAQVMQKLTEYYLKQLQLIQNQKKMTATEHVDQDGNISCEEDLEDTNQLQYGNLTIYPLKNKVKEDVNEPMDLSYRSKSNTSSSYSEEESKSEITSITHKKDYCDIVKQENKTEVGIESIAPINSMILPYLLKNFMNQDESNNKVHSRESVLKNASVLQMTDLKERLGSTEDSSDLKDKRSILNSVLASILKRSDCAESVEAADGDSLIDSDCTEDTASPKNLPQSRRRRTTVFSETQHRILYQHFTHCNFPEPAMFRILANLIGLEAAVIKIWFQNERSRQRKRANFILEGNKTFADKPYKCVDCDMSFAMATFLVKHSARHAQQEQNQSTTKVCPICTLKFENDFYTAHLKSVHQVDMVFENTKSVDEKEDAELLTCYLCQKCFEDQEALFLHKRDHLSENFGNVSTCTICDSSFVNAICLEAHMQTHFKLDWKHQCRSCKAVFPEEILLKSHEMSHGIPAPAISSVNRYRSQNCEGIKKTTPSLGLNQDKLINVSSILESHLRSAPSNNKVTPIKITTPQVKTAQSGTPIAVKTTDQEGRQIIQFLPVQLVPTDDKSDNLGNDESKPKTKCKKKLPDLIPIADCNVLNSNILRFDEQAEEKAVTSNFKEEEQGEMEPDHPHNSVLYSLLSEKFRTGDGVELQSPSNDYKKDTSEVEMKSMDSDDAAMSDDELIIDEGAYQDSEEDIEGVNDGDETKDCLDLFKNISLEELRGTAKEKLLLALQNSVQYKVEADNQQGVVESSTAPLSKKSDDGFEFKKFRNRREYTQEEQLILLTHFQHNHFPPSRELRLIAHRLNITQRQIMHWFQNRRSRERKVLPYSRRVSKQCPECKSSFVHDDALDSHKNLAHSEDKITLKYWCSANNCQMSFHNMLLLQTHEFEHKKSVNVNNDDSELKVFAEGFNKHRKILPKSIPTDPSPPCDMSSLSSLLNLTPPLSNLPPLEPLTSPPPASSESSSGEIKLKTVVPGLINLKDSPVDSSSSEALRSRLSELELHFQENNYPAPQELIALSQQYGVDGKELSDWYEALRNRTLTESSTPYYDSEHNCPMCSAAFVTKSLLQEHIRVHSQSSVLTCEVCSAVFRHELVYDLHVHMHSSGPRQADSLTTVALLSPTHSVEYSVLKSNPSKSEMESIKINKSSSMTGPNNRDKNINSDMSEYSKCLNLITVQNVPSDANDTKIDVSENVNNEHFEDMTIDVQHGDVKHQCDEIEKVDENSEFKQVDVQNFESNVIPQTNETESVSGEHYECEYIDVLSVESQNGEDEKKSQSETYDIKNFESTFDKEIKQSNENVKNDSADIKQISSVE